MRRLHEVRFLVGAASAHQFPHLSLPEIAFVGRSNVGKSSLLNCLVGRTIARVSKTPGRTQQINFFLIDHRIIFADLPGYGFAKVSLAIRQQWARLIEQYLETREQLRAVLLLVDLRRGMEREERELLQWLSGLGLSCVVVATKADRASQSERAKQSRALKSQLDPMGIELIVSSAAKGEGIEEIWRAILRCCEQQACRAGTPRSPKG
ncbi:putative GTP-binding protein EngB [bacterium HR30]|nr:putative GTP-binding protein EngB [bacterium HR30]